MARKRPSARVRNDDPGKGRVYGERQEQERALQSVPLPHQAETPPPADFGQVLAAAQRTSGGSVLESPTEDPDEPVTAGLPFGAGPGPEALTTTGNPDLEALRPFLPMLELAANQPGASASTRNLIRRLRGAMPL